MDKNLEKILFWANLAWELMLPEEQLNMLTEQRKNFVYGNVKIHNPNVTRKMIDATVIKSKGEPE